MLLPAKSNSQKRPSCRSSPRYPRAGSAPVLLFLNLLVPYLRQVGAFARSLEFSAAFKVDPLGLDLLCTGCPFDLSREVDVP